MKTFMFVGILCVMVLCASRLSPVMGSDSEIIGTKSVTDLGEEELVPQEARWGRGGYGDGWGRGGYGGGWGRGGYGRGWGRGGYGGGWGREGYGRSGYGWGRR